MFRPREIAILNREEAQRELDSIFGNPLHPYFAGDPQAKIRVAQLFEMRSGRWERDLFTRAFMLGRLQGVADG